MVFLALVRCLLLFLIVSPLRVSFSTSRMNFLSAADKENSEKHSGTYPCLYCRKVFTNHRALGGHLKSHNVEIKSRWRRHHPGSSSLSTNPNPLSSNQPENSFGGAGINLSKSSCSNKTIPMYTTFAPSGSTAASGVPLDPALCLDLSLGLYGVGRTDEDQTGGEGMSFFFGDVLQKFRQNLSKPSFPAFTVANPCSGLDLNQSPGSKETITFGSFPMDPCPCSDQDEGFWYKMKNSLTCEEGKRQYSLDTLGNAEMMRASKRPKIISNLPVEVQKFQNKEAPLFFKDAEKPFSGLGISFAAELEGPADIDLSLHL